MNFTMAANVPTVVYLSPDIMRPNLYSRPFFQPLKDCGILHDSPEDGFGEVTLHTRWLEEESGLPEAPPENPELAAVLATGICWASGADRGAAPRAWRLSGPAWQSETWQAGATPLSLRYKPSANSIEVRSDEQAWQVRAQQAGLGIARVEVDGVLRTVRFASASGGIDDGEPVYLHWGDGEAVLIRAPRLPVPIAAGEDAGSCVAQTPGTVRAIHVSEGDAVSAGDALITLESMKVEQTLTASADGEVTQVRVAVGDSVAQGDVLVVVD